MARQPCPPAGCPDTRRSGCPEPGDAGKMGARRPDPRRKFCGTTGWLHDYRRPFPRRTRRPPDDTTILGPPRLDDHAPFLKRSRCEARPRAEPTTEERRTAVRNTPICKQPTDGVGIAGTAIRWWAPYRDFRVRGRVFMPASVAGGSPNLIPRATGQKGCLGLPLRVPTTRSAGRRACAPKRRCVKPDCFPCHDANLVRHHRERRSGARAHEDARTQSRRCTAPSDGCR